jgi:hypothetical protein
MRPSALALLTVLALVPMRTVGAQGAAQIRVTPEAVLLRSASLTPEADVRAQEGHPVHWGRVGLGALFGAAAGGVLGLWIHSMEDVGDSSPADVFGLAALGAIVGAFVGLATGS